MSHISFYSHEDQRNLAFFFGFRSAFSDDLHLAMANLDETKTVCECRCTSQDKSVKGSFSNVLNIHEIDEEESETEETTILEQSNPSAPNEEDDQVTQETKEASDEESVYSGESFCSDESCDESEVTNVASGSLNPSLLPRTVDLQRSQNSKELDADVSESRWRDESCSMSDEPSRIATADRPTRPRRRWNMSFTDEEMRRIERENELLLRKIMEQQKPRHRILGERSVPPRTSSSAINRKKLQKRIDDDNMVIHDFFRYRRCMYRKVV